MTLLFALAALACCGVAGFYAWRGVAVEGTFGEQDPASLKALQEASRFNRAATIWMIFGAALAALATLAR